jgi:hypothetical protein
MDDYYALLSFFLLLSLGNVWSEALTLVFSLAIYWLMTLMPEPIPSIEMVP